ncbi:DNA-binding IclR family transcriptional regulator [Bradyrhizobium sp. S3.12.5]|uniref:IclR family transcriptional regulator n=1 Tax=Bradyrhizobium sp. S3.12.5 TaxID=3156386 RepID=UPI0033961B02
MKETAESGEQRVESVERAFAILEAFADGRPRMPLAELAQRTGLYRSTILRLAASLDRCGYLRRDDDGQFRLGPSLLRLGALYQSAFSLADSVRPILRELADELGETAAFYVRDRDKRICLYRVNSSRIVRSHVEEGAELPLDRGASARILVAYTDGHGPFYEKIRQSGVYISQGERDPDTAAVAVPVFGSHQKIVGALGVTGPRNRFTKEFCKKMIEVLTQKGKILSRTISGQ